MRKAVAAFGDAFSPLKIRNLRIYLSGQLVSLLGTWMQTTAQAWVVWTLTKSAASLGLVAMLGSLPLLLLGPFAGAWADRLDRRRVLIVTQSVAAVLACILALLVQTNTVQIWHVYLLAIALGVVGALDFPAQQAFIGDITGRENIRKAVVVNAMINQLSRMMGPTLAGWVLAALGVAPAFWLNGLSFVAVICSLVVITSNQQRHDRPAGGASVLGEFWEGMKFIGTQPRIQDLMIFATLCTFFGISNMQIMAAVADTVLHRGADALGLLMGASGAGALVTTIVIVPIAQRMRRTGVVLAVATAWAGAWYMIFSQSTWMPFSMFALFCTGLGIPVVLTTVNGLVQFLAPGHMRARLVSAYLMVSFGMQPLSGLLVGYDAQFFGAPRAILFNGFCMVAGASLLLLFRPGLRTWEPNAQRPHEASRPEAQAAMGSK